MCCEFLSQIAVQRTSIGGIIQLHMWDYYQVYSIFIPCPSCETHMAHTPYYIKVSSESLSFLCVTNGFSSLGL